MADIILNKGFSDIRKYFSNPKNHWDEDKVHVSKYELELARNEISPEAEIVIKGIIYNNKNYSLLSKVQSEGIFNDGELSLRDLYSLEKGIGYDGYVISLDEIKSSIWGSEEKKDIIYGRYLIKAFKNGDTKFIKNAIDNLSDINAALIAYDSTPYTLLMLAVKLGDVGIVNQLLDMGADSSVLNEYGMNALSFNVSSNKEEIEDILLANGANEVEIKNIDEKLASLVNKKQRCSNQINVEVIQALLHIKIDSDSNETIRSNYVEYIDDKDYLRRLIDSETATSAYVKREALNRYVVDNFENFSEMINCGKYEYEIFFGALNTFLYNSVGDYDLLSRIRTELYDVNKVLSVVYDSSKDNSVKRDGLRVLGYFSAEQELYRLRDEGVLEEIGLDMSYLSSLWIMVGEALQKASGGRVMYNGPANKSFYDPVGIDYKSSNIKPQW